MITNSKLIGSVSAITIAMAWSCAAPAEAQSSPDQESAETALTTGAPEQDTEDQLVADKIIVTGSSIRGVPPTGSNLIGVTRDDIELIGAATTPDQRVQHCR